MWVSRTNTEIAVLQWSTLCVDVERTSKGAELHTAVLSLSSHLSDSWFPSKHPVLRQNPHFVIYPGDLVHLQSAILSTIYSLGKRLALEQGRSLNPSSVFTAQFIQIDNLWRRGCEWNQVVEPDLITLSDQQPISQVGCKAGEGWTWQLN